MYSVEIHGSIKADLATVMGRLGDFSRLLPQLGTLAMDSQKMNIEEGVDPDGRAYDELAPSTIRARGEGHPYGVRPLLDTTNMYQSIHYEVRGGDMVWAGPDMNQADYFPFVENRANTRMGVPSRIFIGFRDEDGEEMSDLLAEHTVGALR